MAITQERPQSPIDGWHVKDDFIGNDAVGDATVGELDWELVSITGGSTVALETGTPTSFGGVVSLTTDGTTAHGEVLRGFTDGLVLRGGQGGFAFRAQMGTTLTGNNFRIGLDDSVTATAPDVGITVLSDSGVVTLQTHSNDHGDATQAAAGVSTLTSGTTMVVDTWHNFLVTWSGTNGQGGPRFVELFIDGEPAASVFCNIDNDEEVELKIVHWDDSGGGAAQVLFLDYYEAWAWDDRSAIA